MRKNSRGHSFQLDRNISRENDRREYSGWLADWRGRGCVGGTLQLFFDCKKSIYIQNTSLLYEATSSYFFFSFMPHQEEPFLFTTVEFSVNSRGLISRNREEH